MTFAVYPRKIDLDIDFTLYFPMFVWFKNDAKNQPLKISISDLHAHSGASEIAISDLHAQSGAQWVNNEVIRSEG